MTTPAQRPRRQRRHNVPDAQTKGHDFPLGSGFVKATITTNRRAAVPFIVLDSKKSIVASGLYHPPGYRSHQKPRKPPAGDNGPRKASGSHQEAKLVIETGTVPESLLRPLQAGLEAAMGVEP